MLWRAAVRWLCGTGLGGAARGAAGRSGAGWAALLSVALVLASGEARSMCNVIPGVESEFRGALGTLNRPYAIPGDEGERIHLELGACDGASPGFASLDAADYVVTVVFTPPEGPTNAVVQVTDCCSHRNNYEIACVGGAAPAIAGLKSQGTAQFQSHSPPALPLYSDRAD